MTFLWNELKKLVQSAICCLLEKLLLKRFELDILAFFCNISTACTVGPGAIANYETLHCSTLFLKRYIKTWASTFVLIIVININISSLSFMPQNTSDARSLLLIPKMYGLRKSFWSQEPNLKRCLLLISQNLKSRHPIYNDDCVF